MYDPHTIQAQADLLYINNAYEANDEGQEIVHSDVLNIALPDAYYSMNTFSPNKEHLNQGTLCIGVRLYGGRSWRRECHHKLRANFVALAKKMPAFDSFSSFKLTVFFGQGLISMNKFA